MWYLATFLLGGAAAVFLTWLWGFMTGPSHGGIVQELDEYKAAGENEKLLEEFARSGLPEMDRRGIWLRMGWIWKETRGWVFRHGGAVGFLFLGFFALLYIYLWFKTLLFPNSDDLRILLGGRGLLLYVLRKENGK